MWRAATIEDDPAVIRLYLALQDEDPGVFPANRVNTERTLELFRAAPERGRCLVLDEQGGIEGYAFLVPYWSNELGGLLCCIDELYVASAARGRGRGGALLAALAAGRFGFASAVALELEVSPSNRRAHALYERHGFQPITNSTLRRLLMRP